MYFYYYVGYNMKKKCLRNYGLILYMYIYRVYEMKMKC